SLAASSSGGRLGSLTPLGVWPTHDFPSGGTCCAAGTRLSATTANAAAALMVTRKRRFIIRSPDPAIQKLSSALFAFSRGRNLRRPDVEPELPELFVLFVVGPAALEDVRQPVVTLVAAIFQHRLRRVHRQRHRESPRPNPRLRILYRDRPAHLIRRVARELLDQAQILTRPLIRDFEVRRLDHERVAFPMTTSVTHISPDRWSDVP